jgi:hypothetical protein
MIRHARPYEVGYRQYGTNAASKPACNGLSLKDCQSRETDPIKDEAEWEGPKAY